MDSAEDFEAFVAIVDGGSISEAARDLEVPRASLSRQLARLEERLGVRLLHRTTRTLVLTDAGEALYPRARAIAEDAAAAVEAVRQLDDVPRGLLRISAPPVNTPLLGELVGAYLKANPEVQVELNTTTEHVDLAADRVDVAMRAGPVRDPNLIRRVLRRATAVAVASPDYLDARGTPKRAQDLCRHACLRGFSGGVRPSTTWPLLAGGTIEVDGPFVTNDLMTLLGAVLDGVGIGILPFDLVVEGLDDGSLKRVLPRAIGVETQISLVWLEREFLDPKIRAFVDLATQWAKNWAR